MGGTGHPSTPITADFVARWEPSYDTRKYPVDFYLNCTASARQAKSPENLKDVLLAVLHWKDGKALSFVPGEIHAKNLGPILMLNGAALAEFAQLFLTLVEATDDNLRERAAGLRKTLAVMWELCCHAGLCASRGKTGSAADNRSTYDEGIPVPDSCAIRRKTGYQVMGFVQRLHGVL